MPLEINPITHPAVGDLTFYLNVTDGQYHLRMLIQNTLPVTVDSIGIKLSFEDRATGEIVHDLTTVFIDDSKVFVLFDIDTGYTQAQLNQFQYLKVMIT